MNSQAPQTQLLDAAMICEIEEMVPPAERAAFLSEIFGLFDSTAPQSIVAIKLACARRDAPALGVEAHRLKGSCLSIGAVALGDVCAALEHAGRKGDVPASGDQTLLQLEDLFKATQAALNLRLKQAG